MVIHALFSNNKSLIFNALLIIDEPEFSHNHNQFDANARSFDTRFAI
jgi:hypothetical protein